MMLGASCSSPAATNTSSQPANTLPRDFSYAQVHVGDRIEGLAVTKIEARDASKPVSANNVVISFEGEKNVSGDLYRDNVFGVYCLNVDDQAPLPRLQEDTYRNSFCFHSSSISDEILKDREGKKVTVTITNYQIAYTPAEPGTENITGNSADLKL